MGAYKRILTGEPVPRNLPPQTDLFGEAPSAPQMKQVNSKPGGISDPRSDLAEDTGLWTQVFTLAMTLDVKSGRNKALFGALHGMRCAGTRLVKSGKTGRLMFRPLVGKDGWGSEADYKEAAAKYLKPFDRDMKELLRQLNGEEDVEARRDCPWQ